MRSCNCSSNTLLPFSLNSFDPAPHTILFLTLVSPLPLSVYVVRSPHSVVLTHYNASCSKVFEGATGLQATKLWLGTPCRGVPPLIDSRASVDALPHKFTKHIPAFVGGSPIHHSHDLWFYRGLVYCNLCGFFAAQAVRKLKQPCGDNLVEVPAPQGKDNLSRIRMGVLPRAVKEWPYISAPSILQPLPTLS